VRAEPGTVARKGVDELGDPTQRLARWMPSNHVFPLRPEELAPGPLDDGAPGTSPSAPSRRRPSVGGRGSPSWATSRKTNAKLHWELAQFQIPALVPMPRTPLLAGVFAAELEARGLISRRKPFAIQAALLEMLQGESQQWMLAGGRIRADFIRRSGDKIADYGAKVLSECLELYMSGRIPAFEELTSIFTSIA
jgi:hypothetical protein